ncbi:ATP-binding protein [Trichocoleus sp. FACHB-46]|nr:ATP-binding protein [Trichocoleus sp. FACHB-46]
MRFQVTSQNRLQVTTNLAELNQVLLWFEQLHQPTIPRKTWIQCQTALAEGFTNAVKHAHSNLPPDTIVEIDVTITPQQLEIYVWDFGPPFDLIQNLKSREQTFDPTASSGRGLQLIARIADQISYVRTDEQRNCLSMIKYYQAS